MVSESVWQQLMAVECWLQEGQKAEEDYQFLTSVVTKPKFIFRCLALASKPEPVSEYIAIV